MRDPQERRIIALEAAARVYEGQGAKAGGFGVPADVVLAMAEKFDRYLVNGGR